MKTLLKLKDSNDFGLQKNILRIIYHENQIHLALNWNLFKYNASFRALKPLCNPILFIVSRAI